MKKYSSAIMIFIFTLFLILVNSVPVCAESIICNNETVSTGASKAEVKNICGEPLSISQDAIINTAPNVWTTQETWTYIINDCYREFIFDGNRLYQITHGRVAR